MVYNVVVVVVLLKSVSVALPVGVTVDGLTMHVGVSVVATVAVTPQVKETVPVYPLAAVTSIDDDVVPPGATAFGVNGEICSVNSVVPTWAEAKGASISHASKPNTGIVARIILNLKGLDRSTFTMDWL